MPNSQCASARSRLGMFIVRTGHWLSLKFVTIAQSARQSACLGYKQKGNYYPLSLHLGIVLLFDMNGESNHATGLFGLCGYDTFGSQGI